MEKKKSIQATEFESFDDGLDFNFDDFDFEERELPDDRHPVIKALSPVGTAVRSFATDQNNIEKFVKASLPRGYGQVHELGTETVGEIQSLYNSAKEELKPIGDAAKGFIGRALPKIGDKLPKGLRERLESFSQTEESWQSSRGANQEEKLAGLLGEVFTNQQEQRIVDQQGYVEKENLRQGFEQVRHRDSISQLDAIRQAVESQSQYNGTINYNFQKKSLEINYRSFWALTELVKEQKESNAKLISELKATSKNTGLPDFVKINTSEAARQIIRNKFLENARERMFGGAQTYIKRFSRNLKEQTTSALSGVAAGASAANDAAGMLEGSGMSQKDQTQMLASSLVSVPLNMLSERGAAWLREKTEKNRTLRRGDAQLRNFVDSAGERLEDELTNPNKDWGGLEGFREVLRNAAPNGAVDLKLEADMLGRQHEATPWTRQSAKSINEVIPGMLARIHQELQILRTGDENADLLTYDFVKNKFSSQKAIGSRLKQSLGASHGERFQKGVSDLVDTVDRGKKLTPEQRVKAQELIAKRAIEGKSLDVSKVTSSLDWGGGDDGHAIAELFARYLKSIDGKLGKTGKAAERQLNLSKQFSGLTANLTDPRVELQTLTNAGQLETLRASGLVNEKDDTVSRDAIVRALMDYRAPTAPPAVPTTTAVPAQAKPVAAQAPGPLSQAVAAAKDPLAPVTPVPSPTPSPSVSLSDSSPYLPEIARHAQAQLTELQAIKQALLAKAQGKAPVTTGVDESNLAKDVKSIDSRIEQLLQAFTSGAGIQVNIMSAIADKMGVQNPGRAMGNVEMFTRGAAGLVGSIADHTAKTAKGVFNKVLRPISDTVNSAIGFGARKATDTFTRVTGILGDVYVSGALKPRLRKAVMEAGGYVDAVTGKVITSLDEIKGDVKDLQGNVVMTYEEFAKGFVGGRWKKPVTAVIRGLKDTVTNTVARVKDLVTNFLPNSLRGAYGQARKVLSAATGLLPPYDVYVKGEMEKPVLYATSMTYGEYFSEKTAKPIKHPRDIDGPVKNSKGDYKLTAEQLEKGLVDIEGRAIKLRFVTRLLGFGVKAVSGAFSKLRDAGTAALGALGGLAEKFGGVFKDIFKPFTLFAVTTKETNEWLKKIHDIIDMRMPGVKKVAGDLDGDGIREGSLKDMLNKRKEQEKEKNNDSPKSEEKKTQSLLSKLMSGAGALFGRNKKEEKEDEEDDGDGFGLSDAADAAEIYDALDGDKETSKKGKRKSKRRNRLGRKARKAPKIPKTTGAKPGLLSRAGGAVARTAAAGAVSPVLLNAAAGAAGAVGTAASATAGAVGAAASGVAAVASAASPYIARAALGLLSAPVAGAITLAWGGYMLYKYMQKTKPTALSRLRLVQYGVKPDDMDAAKKLWEFESVLEKALVGDGDRLGLDMKKIDQKEIVKLMGLVPGDAQIFNEYFRTRFTPVFVGWMKVARKYSPSGSLSDIEDLVPEKDKWTVAESTVSSLAQVYEYKAGWAANQAHLVSGYREVSDYLESIRMGLMKKSEKAGGAKATVLEKASAGTTLSSASERASAAMKQQDMYKVTDRDGKELDVNQMKHAELAEKLRTGDVSVQVKLSVPKVLMHNASLNQVDALTSVRMKAYGLKEMTLSKVQQLGALELYMQDHMEGSSDAPVAGVKPEQVMRDVADVFGIAGSDERHKNRWRYWFNGRFLPVFLMYAGTVRKKTSKKELTEGSKLLSLGDQLSLARALVTARGVSPGGGTGPVWHNPTNPWKEEYELNDNADTTAGNIEAIRLLADKIALGEVEARSGGNSEQDPTKAAFGFFKKPLKRVNKDDTGGKTLSHVQASGDKLTGDALNKAGTAEQKGTALNPSGGKALNFGSVKNGAYSSLPEMKGKGWSAAKDLVVAAAKATGVDAQALATVIAQESSFDPNATPTGYPSPSSAKGLGQHLPGSWAEDMKFHAQELGIPQGTSPFDPKAAALLTAMRMRRNGLSLEKTLKRKVTTAEAYMAHFMGGGGASSVLEMGGGELSMNSSSGSAAKKQHPEYFVDPRSGKPRTVSETVKYITDKLNGKLGEFQISSADLNGARMTVDDNPALAAAMSTDVPVDTAVQEVKNKANGILPTTKAVPVQAVQPPAAKGAVAGGSYSASATNLNAPTTLDLSKKANIAPTNPMPLTPGGLTLQLERAASEEDGIYGVLRLPDGTSFMTLELPWRNNAPRLSCIPPGSYKARRRQTSKFGFAFEVLGVQGRSGILIHGGTFAGSRDKGQKANSEGCILLGMGRGHTGKQKMITGYKEAMEAFYNRMGNHTEFSLVVKGPDSATQALATSAQPEVNLQSIRESAASSPVAPMAPPSAPQASTAPSSASAPVGGAYASTAPSQPSQGAATPLPRLSTPGRALDPRSQPSAADMRARDEALTKVIAPKFDGIQTTLSEQLLELKKIVSLLEVKAEPAKQGSPTSATAPQRPSTSPAATITQRRNI